MAVPLNGPGQIPQPPPAALRNTYTNGPSAYRAEHQDTNLGGFPPAWGFGGRGGRKQGIDSCSNPSFRSGKKMQCAGLVISFTFVLCAHYEKRP